MSEQYRDDEPRDPTAPDWNPPAAESEPDPERSDPEPTDAEPTDPQPEPTEPGPTDVPAAPERQGTTETQAISSPATSPIPSSAPAPENPYAAPPVSPYPYGASSTYGQASQPVSGQAPYGQPAYGQSSQGQQGQPAYGQPDQPAGDVSPYWQQSGADAPSPYATPAMPNPYGNPPGAPPTYARPGGGTNVSAVVLLVLSGGMTLLCCITQIPALILAIVALSRQTDDPDGSRRMSRIGWIAFAAGIVVLLLVVGGLVAWGVVSTSSGVSSSQRG